MALSSPMGLYDRYVLPRLTDRMSSGPDVDRYRRQVLAAARGRVLDVGFGTGLNAPHYPAGVERVIAIDPNPGVLGLAQQRIAAAPVPIELQLGSGDQLPFPDHSFDTVVTTLVLCTIPRVQQALSEIRRVLKPGGKYLFMEHGLADDANVRKWQHRLNPIQMFVAGGCRLDRDVRGLVLASGFRLDNVEQFYFPKAPRPMGFMSLGQTAPNAEPS